MELTVTDEIKVPLLFNEPKTDAQRAFISRIIDRARTLFADGYRAQQYGKTPVYAIFKPGNTAATNGYRDYSVQVSKGQESCDCDGFMKHKDCKHRIAVALMLAEEQALCEEYERTLGNGETPNGCDGDYYLD
jgi:hypothetical protein